MMDREEVLKQATSRYYTDKDLFGDVEEGIMIALSQVVIPGKHDEIREAARIAAACALLIREHREKEAGSSPPTTSEWITVEAAGGNAGGRGSFGVIVHAFGVTDTAESITANEKIVWIECGSNLIATKQFSRTTEQGEIESWVNTMLEEHNKTCPLVQEKKGE